jgi:small-conductance mechanosensitive channel
MCIRFSTFLLLTAFIGSSVVAQETETAGQPATPKLESLGAGWWSYFDGTRADVEPRVKAFLELAGPQIAELDPSNQVAAESSLKATQDNFSAYMDLLDEPEPVARELPASAEAYSIEELLALAATARSAETEAVRAQAEAERAERALRVASRRRDAAFDDYVAAEAGDPRWLAALRLVQARTTLAIAQRRQELLELSFNEANAFAGKTAARVEIALDSLSATVDEAELAKLDDRIGGHETAVETAREKLRVAQLAASGLDLETPLGRSQQRLQEQLVLTAEVELGLEQTSLAGAQALRWWARMQSDAGFDAAALEEQALGWSELIRGIERRNPEIKRETEGEILAVQSVDQEGLDRAARQLLDKRLGVAKETLADLSDLDAAAADLELLSVAVDNAAAEGTGKLQSWFSALERQAQGLYRRIAGLTQFTLFTVGETPVDGGDILRVLFILALALLLSRGIRHAINRVAENDQLGTHASLYTVGRLTHYTIIVIALLVALSSIGLDFSNLALVAGALSVGIGFGLQSIVSNFVSGLIILFEQSLRVGDYIELDTGVTGTVKAINVRSTLINTNDNIDIVVPNSEFVTSRLTNWTLGEKILRVRIPFGVAYGTDKELLKKAALEAAAEVPYTLTHMKGREPDIWLVEYGDNSLNFLLLVWVNRQGARRPTRTRAAYLWALETKLAEYGIEIPFPQRDLHLRSGFSGIADKPAPSV